MKTHRVIAVVALGFVLCLGAAILQAQRGGADRRDESDRKNGFDKRDDSDRRDDSGKRDGDDARVQAGFDYALSQGLTLKFKRKDRDLVGLGSYLVNAVGGCNDCHTAPPFTQDPYAFLGAPKQVNLGCYLAGGTPFGDPTDPATPVSRDITPWEDEKPAGLTFAQFLHLMRTGEDPDNPGQLLQVMPWPVYQSMLRSDLRAIYEYLSSIPAIPAGTCGVPSE